MVIEFIRKVQCCHMYFPTKKESCDTGFLAFQCSSISFAF